MLPFKADLKDKKYSELRTGPMALHRVMDCLATNKFQLKDLSRHVEQKSIDSAKKIYDEKVKKNDPSPLDFDAIYKNHSKIGCSKLGTVALAAAFCSEFVSSISKHLLTKESEKMLKECYKPTESAMEKTKTIISKSFVTWMIWGHLVKLIDIARCVCGCDPLQVCHELKLGLPKGFLLHLWHNSHELYPQVMDKSGYNCENCPLLVNQFSVNMCVETTVGDQFVPRIVHAIVKRMLAQPGVYMKVKGSLRTEAAEEKLREAADAYRSRSAKEFDDYLSKLGAAEVHLPGHLLKQYLSELQSCGCVLPYHLLPLVHSGKFQQAEMEAILEDTVSQLPVTNKLVLGHVIRLCRETLRQQQTIDDNQRLTPQLLGRSLSQCIVSDCPNRPGAVQKGAAVVQALIENPKVLGRYETCPDCSGLWLPK